MHDGQRRRVAAMGRRAGLCGALLLLGVGAAAAASGHAEHHTPSVSDLLLPLVNFLLFVWLLRRAGAGALSGYFRRRRDEVIGLLDTAAAARSEAEQLHGEMRSRLAQVEEEGDRLRRDMRAMAMQERERRRELIASAAARVTADARFIAEQEVRAARAGLRRETATAATAEAVALLQRQIASADHERFLREFVSGVRGAA
jgi:F-type H+-transporting ATPase subunit b